MTRVLKFVSIAILVLSMSELVHASISGDKNFNFYLAAGPNFIFPTSVRVGWNRWEFGTLTRGFVGFNKTFPISGRSIYAGFAVGINSDPFPSNAGFQASVGFNYELFWQLGLRGELLANANLNGSTMSHALLGVSYGF